MPPRAAFFMQLKIREIPRLLNSNKILLCRITKFKKMKKLFLSVSLIAIVTTVAFSQSVSGGLRLGMNIANQTTSLGGTSISASAKVGLMAGGYLTIMTSEKFGIQPELVFSQFGASASSGGTSMSNNFNYLSLPVILRYNVTPNFNLQAGPQLGILLSASQTSGSTTVDIKDQANGIDFGLVFGAGIDFGKFNGGIRYYIGLTNLQKNVPQGLDLKTTNSGIQIFIGYALFGK